MKTAQNNMVVSAQLKDRGIAKTQSRCVKNIKVGIILLSPLGSAEVLGAAEALCTGPEGRVEVADS